MKLSIITINYNNADGLQKTIQSVLSQSFIDFEYIIIDGASTDRSVDVICSAVEKLEGCKIKWVSEPDKGIYNAMNKGLAMATGEYCLFLNSGDNLHNNEVLTQVVPELGSADIHYCDADFVYPDGTHELHTYPDKLTFDFFYKTTFCHQAVFIKTDAIRSVGNYDEHYRVIGDRALFVKMLIIENCSYLHHRVCLADFNLEGLSSSQGGREIALQERLYLFDSLIPARILEDYKMWNIFEQNNQMYRFRNIQCPFLRKMVNLSIRVVYKIDRILH